MIVKKTGSGVPGHYERGRKCLQRPSTLGPLCGTPPNRCAITARTLRPGFSRSKHAQQN